MDAPRKILVAADYSDCALHALERALELARKMGAGVEVAHAWAAPFFGPGYTGIGSADAHPSLFELIRERAEQEMGHFVGRADVSEVTVETSVISGEPVTAVLEHAESAGADWIVVGTHGRQGPKRWFLGSVAERLVQLSPRPVLTVPPPHDGERAASLASVERILVPVDLSDHSRDALQRAIELAGVWGAKVDVLHVVAPPAYVPLDMTVLGPAQERYVADVAAAVHELVEEATRGSSIDVPCRVESGVPFEAILTATENADLVVMGTRGRTGMPHLLMGSVAERVVRGAAVPVLTSSSR